MFISERQRESIKEATEMLNLYNQCWEKIDFLTKIKTTYGDLKISEIIESLEYQANKFNKRFQDVIKTE